MELLDHLLSRGDLVALDNGQLTIQPASGRDVPEEWLEEYRDALALTLATRTNTPLYKYVGYTAGSYGKHKADGVTLQFANMKTGEEVYAIFNVNRERVQDSRKGRGKAGAKLPAKQFRITKRMELYKFWLRTGLAEPETKLLSEFHRVMGRLKSVLFVMSTNSNKADKNTIQAATITSMEQHENRGKVGGKTGEEVGKSEGKTTGSVNPAKPSATGLTDETNHVSDEVRLKLIRKEGSKDALQASNTLNTPSTKNTYSGVAPQDQTTEQWLADYDSSVLITTATIP